VITEIGNVRLRKKENKMVKEEKINEKTYYKCEICGFSYADKDWAEKCQAWCKEHNSCNTEIIKHAVK